MMIIKRYHQVWCNFLIVVNFVYIRLGANVNGILIDIDENVLQKICQMKFCETSKTDCGLYYCLEQMATERKFGECSSNVKKTNDTPPNNCYDDCGGQDYRCSGASKCCWNGICNRSCEANNNLERIPLLTLPSVPSSITVLSTEHEKHRTAEISWRMRSHHNRYNDRIDYVIEARAHIGNEFSSHKLGQWFAVDFHDLNSQRLHSQINFNFAVRANVILKIGRWYQFRILSLNGNGTRGYSNVSQPFQLNEKPKHLRVPNNFQIAMSPILLPNNSIYAKLSWRKAESDYPCESYEFTWSRFIGEGNGSLFMEKIVVPEFQHFFELNDLMPDQYYYMQLNALSSFGRKKLRSEKLSVLSRVHRPFYVRFYHLNMSS